MFLTWNESKDQLCTMLNIPSNEQQYEHIQIISSIGQKVHFLNVELSHDKGILRTKVYHNLGTDEHELPDKFEYGENKPSKLIQAAVIDAVRCCSAEDDFHEELRHLRHCHLLRGFSAQFVRQNMIEFFVQFHVGKMCNGVITVPYDDLRQRVLEHHQQQLTMKKQRQIEQENILRLPYPSHLDAQLASDIKRNIQELMKNVFGSETESNTKEIEMVPRPDSPLSMNDYLVDKKPPCRLLTLSEREKNKQRM